MSSKVTKKGERKGERERERERETELKRGREGRRRKKRKVNKIGGEGYREGRSRKGKVEREDWYSLEVCFHSKQEKRNASLCQVQLKLKFDEKNEIKNSLNI